MKAPDDKGLRAMAFYECIHPKIKLTEEEEQEQRMNDCSAEQNSTTGILYNKQVDSILFNLEYF